MRIESERENNQGFSIKGSGTHMFVENLRFLQMQMGVEAFDMDKKVSCKARSIAIEDKNG